MVAGVGKNFGLSWEILTKDHDAKVFIWVEALDRNLKVEKSYCGLCCFWNQAYLLIIVFTTSFHYTLTAAVQSYRHLADSTALLQILISLACLLLLSPISKFYWYSWLVNGLSWETNATCRQSRYDFYRGRVCSPVVIYKRGNAEER